MKKKKIKNDESLDQNVEFWKNASPKECARAVKKLVREKLYKGERI